MDYLLAAVLFSVVWVLNRYLPCGRYWKDFHGYPTGPCRRPWIHWGSHSTDTPEGS